MVASTYVRRRRIVIKYFKSSKIINYLIPRHNSVRIERIIYLNYAKFVLFKMVIIIIKKKLSGVFTPPRTLT